jgi:hypothetical protein
MKKLTDKELISFFQERMEGFEADPLTSWETLEPRLNARKKTRLAPWIISALILSSIIFTVSYHPRTAAHENVGSISSDDKLDESNNLTDVDDKKAKAGTLSPSILIKRVEIDVKENDRKDKNVGLSNHKLRTTDYLFSSGLQVEILKIKIPVFKEAGTDTSHHEPSNKIKMEVLVSGFVSYNTAYFQPLNYDRTEIQNFNNSPDRLDNRLGLGLGVKLRRQMKNGNKFEYFGGVNYLKKNFEYKGFLLAGDEQISYFSKQVNGVYLAGAIGGALHFQRTPFRSRAWVSLAFQQSLFKSHLRKYFGSNQVNLTMGVPFDLGGKLEMVPQVRYSIPLKRNLVDFQMNNIAWGIELNYKLRRN